ncbi:MAG TPA: hypothetical protein VEV17_00120 [Bryobacteraceae bacterium]|nr:hypothetical protein [Bryobacteraceae bacterium]
MSKLLLFCAALILALRQSAAVTLTATPSALTFSAQAGSTTLPSAQTVSVKASSGTPSCTTSIAPATATWLTVSPDAGACRPA